MRRDLSLGMPIPSRQLRGIGIPRDIAAAKAQGLRMKWKTESSRSCFSRRFMEARRFSSVSGAPSALGLSLPFGFDNYAAFC